MFVHSLHARCTGHCSNMFSLHRHLKLAAFPRVVLVRVIVLGVSEEEAALHTDDSILLDVDTQIIEKLTLNKFIYLLQFWLFQANRK